MATRGAADPRQPTEQPRGARPSGIRFTDQVRDRRLDRHAHAGRHARDADPGVLVNPDRACHAGARVRLGRAAARPRARPRRDPRAQGGGDVANEDFERILAASATSALARSPRRCAAWLTWEIPLIIRVLRHEGRPRASPSRPAPRRRQSGLGVVPAVALVDGGVGGAARWSTCTRTPPRRRTARRAASCAGPRIRRARSRRRPRRAGPASRAHRPLRRLGASRSATDASLNDSAAALMSFCSFLSSKICPSGCLPFCSDAAARADS